MLKYLSQDIGGSDILKYCIAKDNKILGSSNPIALTLAEAMCAMLT